MNFKLIFGNSSDVCQFQLVHAIFMIYSLSGMYNDTSYTSLAVSFILHAIYMVAAFVVVALMFYVHGKHLSSCRNGQLT